MVKNGRIWTVGEHEGKEEEEKEAAEEGGGGKRLSKNEEQTGGSTWFLTWDLTVTELNRH